MMAIWKIVLMIIGLPFYLYVCARCLDYLNLKFKILIGLED